MRRILTLTTILSFLLIAGPHAVGGGDPADEVRILEDALAKIDEAAVALVELAKVQVRAGRTVEARQTIERLDEVLVVRERLSVLLEGVRSDADKARAAAARRAPKVPVRKPIRAGRAAGSAWAGWYSGRGGQRNLKTNGGSKATQGAVDLGLEWLKNHQSPDGYWDCDNFTTQCKLNHTYLS